jgi:serine protease Do
MNGPGNVALAQVLAMLAAWLVPAAGWALETDEALQRSGSVFRIQAVDARNRVASGTAVLVAPRALVTNCHVVLDAREIAVIDAGRSHMAHIARADVERDLCLLSGPALEAPVATPGDTVRLDPGKLIAAVGYTMEGALTLSRGRIEGLFSYGSRGRVIQGSAHFDAGASGGGLFDDSGRLIGILTFKARAGGAFHFAVPVEWVMDLLANRISSSRSDARSAFWQYTDARQPVFLRAASLAAQGDCAALTEVAQQWLTQEPANPEAKLAAKSAQRCHARTAHTGD